MEEKIIKWRPKKMFCVVEGVGGRRVEKYDGGVKVEQMLVPVMTGKYNRTVIFEGGVKVAVHKEILQTFYYKDRDGKGS